MLQDLQVNLHVGRIKPVWVVVEGTAVHEVLELELRNALPGLLAVDVDGDFLCQVHELAAEEDSQLATADIGVGLVVGDWHLVLVLPGGGGVADFADIDIDSVAGDGHLVASPLRRLRCLRDV